MAECDQRQNQKLSLQCGENVGRKGLFCSTRVEKAATKMGVNRAKLQKQTFCCPYITKAIYFLPSVSPRCRYRYGATLFPTTSQHHEKVSILQVATSLFLLSPIIPSSSFDRVDLETIVLIFPTPYQLTLRLD